MNQKEIVCRALSEVLKIVGALGVVNVFTLAMMYRSIVTHVEGVAESDAGHTFDHYQIIADVRGFDSPDPFTILCGIALLFMFTRFVYGSIILLDGDYVQSSANFTQVQGSDLFSIGSLLLIFPLLSFYGGAGREVEFAGLLALALLVDAFTMSFGKEEGGQQSVYRKPRESWARINIITLIATVVILIGFVVWQQYERKVSSPQPVALAFIALYCISSVVDLWKNRNFYLGRQLSA